MPDIWRHAARLIPNMSETLLRFPVPAMLSASFCLYLIAHINRWFHIDPPSLLLVLVVCAGFAWSLSVSLFAEARGWPRLTGHLIGIIGIGVIILLGAYPIITDISPSLLAGAMTISIGIAPYIGRTNDEAGFWQFNHSLWLGAVIGILSGALFFLGVASVMVSLTYLFGVRIAEDIWADLAAITSSLVLPFTWLLLIPKRFDIEVFEGPQTGTISSAIAALVKYILVPFLLIYAVILHAYALKVGLDWALPKGKLGWMVLGFGGVLTLTTLLVFPTRHSGSCMNRFFWRYWPLMLIVPSILLFMAVGARITQYGFTEKRYLVLLAGLWLGGLCIIFGLGTRWRDLHLIPGLAAILLVFASLGPWGMSGLSMSMQVREFIEILENNGVARNGQILPKGEIIKNRPTHVNRRLDSILHYLRGKNRLDVLAPIFEGSEDDPFEAAAKKRNYPVNWNWYPSRRQAWGANIPYSAIRKNLFITSDTGKKYERRTYDAYADASAKLEGIGWFTGELSMWYHKKYGARKYKFSVGPESLEYEFNGKSVTVTHNASKTRAVFRLTEEKALVDAMAAWERTRLKGRNGIQLAPIVVSKHIGTLDARLIITKIIGEGPPEGPVTWSSIRFHLFFPKLPRVSVKTAP